MKRLKKIANFFALLGLVSLMVYRFWPLPALPPDVLASKIIVVKHKNEMILLNGNEVLKKYRVSLGKKAGPKERQGDERTPVGSYHISARNPGSKYYKAFVISYPNEKDKERAKKLGIKDPGSMIEIHGIKPMFAWVGNIHNLIDYTRGCIAVTNQEMDELWRAVKVGTPIIIRP